MQFLNSEKLATTDVSAFLNTRPFPFINPEGMLTERGYRMLSDNLPDVSVLDASFGKKRSHGQQSHDRYLLEYDKSLSTVPDVWHEFVEELHGPEYSDFIRQTFQRKHFHLNMHWHYAPSGCSVSPHCDASHKLGSHLFYFNDEGDWQPEWGGGTVILNDNGRFDANSAPDFDDFDDSMDSQCVGNYSTLFARRDRSWHGVRQINCPEDKLRKVFIVVINQPILYAGRQLLKRLKIKK